MIRCGAALLELGNQLYRKPFVTSELHQQQQHKMYESDSLRVDNRIMNPSKPHVHPFAGDKAGKKTEFGAKISISNNNKFAEVDQINWENYNEK